MTIHPGPVEGRWRIEPQLVLQALQRRHDARSMRVIVRARPPRGSTQALAHQRKVTALEARHPSFIILPLLAALLQILSIL